MPFVSVTDSDSNSDFLAALYPNLTSTSPPFGLDPGRKLRNDDPMSEEEINFPPFQASAEHDFLATQEGTWNVRCSYSMGPDSDPMVVEGTEKAEMLGPFWIASRFEADLLGSPMSGHGSTGYDPVRKVFVATWKDSSNPFLYTFEGFLDENENTLKLSGEKASERYAHREAIDLFKQAVSTLDKLPEADEMKRIKEHASSPEFYN